MNWKRVRLELARSAEFPHGSASRAYLVHLPLDEQGMIDLVELKAEPQRARVRRYWPNEPDMSGVLTPLADGWSMSCRTSDSADEEVQRLDLPRVSVGQQVFLHGPGGEPIPFGIVSVTGAG